MRYGYIRTGTIKGKIKDEEDVRVQRDALLSAGAEKIIEEVPLENKKERPMLSSLIEEMKEGDTLVITKLSRMAKSLRHASHLLEALLEKGASLCVLDMGVFDSSEEGKRLASMLSRFAEFEKEAFIERAEEGKAIASMAEMGFREGRPRKYTSSQLQEAMKLLGSHSYRQVSAMTGISVSTLSRERRLQDLIAARYSAPTKEDIERASLDDQMDIFDFPEYLPEKGPLTK